MDKIKIIKTITITLLLIIIFLIICTEYDRRTYQTKLQNLGKYFSVLNKVLFSPISCFVKMNSKFHQLVPYPDLDNNFRIQKVGRQLENDKRRSDKYDRFRKSDKYTRRHVF